MTADLRLIAIKGLKDALGEDVIFSYSTHPYKLSVFLGTGDSLEFKFEDDGKVPVRFRFLPVKTLNIHTADFFDRAMLLMSQYKLTHGNAGIVARPDRP